MRIRRVPKLTADRGCEHGELLCSVVQDIARDCVSRHGSFIHQRSQRRDPRPWPVRRIEKMQDAVGIGAACGVDERAKQRGRRSPAFLGAQGGA